MQGRWTLRGQKCAPCSVLTCIHLWCCLLGLTGGVPPASLTLQQCSGAWVVLRPFPCYLWALGCLGLGACVLLMPCIWFQPKVSALGVVQGPSKDKVAILTVDECDASVALQFGNEIGNYSCAAEGVQTSSKK